MIMHSVVISTVLSYPRTSSTIRSITILALTAQPQTADSLYDTTTDCIDSASRLQQAWTLSSLILHTEETYIRAIPYTHSASAHYHLCTADEAPQQTLVPS